MSQELEKTELEIKKVEDALLSPIGEINIPEAEPIGDAEWCFQFFNNEPIVFAYSNEGEEATPLVLQLRPVKGEGLNFEHNGMSFRIFPREISERTKTERANEAIQRQNLQQDIENASKDKEA